MQRKIRKLLIEINHSVRKSFHLQIGYNLNFATTAKALYVGQRIRTKKRNCNRNRRKEGCSETSIHTSMQVKNGCRASGLKDIL